MLDSVINDILVLRYFILTVVGAGLFFTAAACVITASFSWNGRGRILYGWFYNRTDRELAFVSMVILQFLYVVSCAVCGTGMDLSCLAVFAVLAFLKWSFGRMTGIFFRDLVNGVLEFMALFVGNILSGYLKETHFNTAVMIVLVLLRVFLVVYQLYFSLKDISVTDPEMGFGKRKKVQPVKGRSRAKRRKVRG